MNITFEFLVILIEFHFMQSTQIAKINVFQTDKTVTTGTNNNNCIKQSYNHAVVSSLLSQEGLVQCTVQPVDRIYVGTPKDSFPREQ